MPTAASVVAAGKRAIKRLLGDNATMDDTLLVQIDRNLGDQVWAGTRLQDRVGHLGMQLEKDFLDEIDKSLLAQEDYEDFEERMLDYLGVDSKEPMGVLGKMDRQVRNEARFAWNTAMASANVQVDTIPVWKSKLDSSTTPTCWHHHGRPISEVGETPPRHYGCVAPDTTVRGEVVLGLRYSYSGPMRKLRTRSGRHLTITPNHPVMTATGWKAAGELCEGERLIRYCRQVEKEAAAPPTTAEHIEDAPSAIQDVFEALRLACSEAWVAKAVDHDLHGDAQFGDGDVDVVAADRKLLRKLRGEDDAQPIRDGLLEAGDVGDVAHSGCGHLFSLLGAVVAARRLPRGAALAHDGGPVLAKLAPLYRFGLGLVARLHASLTQSSGESDARESDALGQRVDRLAFLVALSMFLRDRQPALAGGGSLDPRHRPHSGDQEAVAQRHVADPGGTSQGEQWLAFDVSTDQFVEVGNVEALRLGMPDDVCSGFAECTLKGRLRNTELQADLLEGFPSMLFADEVVEVRDEVFSGHVYDLQTTVGWYIANDLLISNCRCAVLTVPNPKSTNKEWAQLGRDTLREMREERDSGFPVAKERESGFPWLPNLREANCGTGAGGFQSGNDCAADDAPSTSGATRSSDGKIDTPKFKRWFGDSKVVDDDGAPLVTYHGSNVNIEKFDREFSAQGVFWFTSNKDKILAGESGASSFKHVIPVYLSAKKLAGWEEYEKYGLGELRQMGFDGIKLDDDYVVFEPTQIKSAVANKGTFNPKKPRITESRRVSGDDDNAWRYAPACIVIREGEDLPEPE